MIKSMEDIFKEHVEIRTKQNDLLKLLKFRFPEISFPEIFQEISNKITSIHSISSLDSLFEKVVTEMGKYKD